jgi:uncharacterized protein (DUF1697 family)
MTMRTYISLLRGINVGGHHLIKMAALKNLYEDLGLKAVTTFLQSGNVIFQTARNDTRDFETMLEQPIERRFGFRVSVVIRSPQQLARIVNNSPYAGRKEIDVNRLAVAFLKSRPSPAGVKAMMAAADKSNDECELAAGAIYIHCPRGFAKTLLTNAFLEKHLGVSVTARNWKTTQTLLSLCKMSGT